MNPQLSLVVPFFNNQDSFPSFLNRLLHLPALRSMKWELIVVDDGSGASEFLQSCFRKYSLKGSVVVLSQNRGQREATLLGLSLAIGDWVATIDADLQFEPEQIPLLLETATGQGYSYVIGIPQRTAVTAPRLSVSVFGKRLMDLLLLGKYRKVFHFSSMRIIRKETLERFGVDCIYDIWKIPVETIGNVAVMHHARLHGKSSYNLLKLLRFIQPYFKAILIRYAWFWVLTALCCLWSLGPVYALSYTLIVLTMVALVWRKPAPIEPHIIRFA